MAQTWRPQCYLLDFVLPFYHLITAISVYIIANFRWVNQQRADVFIVFCDSFQGKKTITEGKRVYVISISRWIFVDFLILTR